MGDAYVPTTLAFGQTISVLTSSWIPKTWKQASTQFEALWNEHGARAMKENGCE